MKSLILGFTVFVVLSVGAARASAQTFTYLITSSHFLDGEPNPSYSSGGGSVDVYCGAEAFMSVANNQTVNKTCYPWMSMLPEILDANGHLIVFALHTLSYPPTSLPPGGVLPNLYISNELDKLLTAGNYIAAETPTGSDLKTDDQTPKSDKSTPVAIN